MGYQLITYLLFLPFSFLIYLFELGVETFVRLNDYFHFSPPTYYVLKS